MKILGIVLAIGLFAGGTFVEQMTSLVAIQPIGALPEGVTLWMWRGEKMQFFESPDAICLRAMGGVSLFCRVGAIAALGKENERIIARFAYSERIYLWSTGGRTFER